MQKNISYEYEITNKHCKHVVELSVRHQRGTRNYNFSSFWNKSQRKRRNPIKNSNFNWILKYKFNSSTNPLTIFFN